MNVKTRLGWIRLYEQLGDAGLVCRRCGISRPTLRKWWRRYRAEGIVGLEERSRRPRRPAGRRTALQLLNLTLDLEHAHVSGHWLQALRAHLLAVMQIEMHPPPFMSAQERWETRSRKTAERYGTKMLPLREQGIVLAKPRHPAPGHQNSLKPLSSFKSGLQIA
jgi:transposase-like protein